MNPNWPYIFGTLLILFAFYVTWAATQGKFSPMKPVVNDAAIKDLESKNKTLQESITKAQDSAFEQENVQNQMNGINSDLQRSLQGMMDKINELTKRLYDLEAENAALRKALKEALEQLEQCRKALQDCRAQLLARKMKDQYCNKEPQSLLLR